ncbi:uncharacterized protein LOC105181795 isoform X2 [Harpegnathos saltator]|uniref:uncharacterized protein LOC105181795 isoform X2 n=1 Tax=Harpegnathos saltator TaxID=610380 RepID=UPI000DBEEC0C|nr:uncharacterized protein LOC105181795 isoform X2 [Harpegnathos saltator]
MSTQCNRFVQNAWKKELCSNCFKPKEEHAAADEILRLNVEKASTNLKIDQLQLQSILRGKAVCRKDQRKKNVGFPESLTEIIGYGGDDFFSDGGENNDGFQVDSGASPDDEAPDSEEERALGNLTRANTNFNTITANLTDLGSNGSNETIKSSTTTPPKSFASLMLGRIQRDADGRKTTLLVSVTPFGGDESVPTAKRPIDRKINTINLQSSPFKCKSSNGGLSDNTAEAAKKLNGAERKKTDEQEQKHSPELEKIMDMPLITSANMISVVRKESTTGTANVLDAEKAAEMTQRCAQLCKPDKRNAVLPRNSVPTVKKTEAEASRILAQSGSVGESDYVKRTVAKKSECPKREEEAEGVEVASTPSKNDEAPESDRSMNVAGKDTTNDTDNIKVDSLLREREVDGHCEDMNEKKFCFDSSRELAGEPDGKADEEEVTEPPALPTSPPPIVTTEPRPSFLHGGVINDSKAKPAVPQKPLTFSAKPSSADALLTVRKISNGDYVLPPPSVQNVASRPAVQNFSAQEIGLRRSLKKNSSNEVEQVSSNANPNAAESEGRAKTLSKSTFTPLSTSTITSSTLSLSKNSTENGEVVDENVAVNEDFAEVTPVSVSTMELVRSPNKRRMAPRPPAVESTEELPISSLFARNPGASNLKSDSPVVREKEKRERSSSCSPKFRKAVCDLPDPTSASTKQTVESTSRRTISLSQDSLTTEKEVREEKKRTRNRKGFSLKRFLRMGSRKDMDMISGQTSGARTDEIPSTPQPKPRLEIIHPLELDGAAVEVVGNDRVTGSKIGEDQTDSCGVRSDGTRAARFPPPSAARPGKPPPPPRNQSLEDWSKLDPANKPVRPPPPRAEATKLNVPARTDKTSSKSTWRPTATTTSDSIYANLGEVRSALAPSKPQRTASMRDRVISQLVPKRHDNQEHQDYDGLATVRPTSDSPTSNDSHVYECLSSSPECDSNLELRHGVGVGGGFRAACKRKSDSSAMENGAEMKFHHQPFVRSTSLPYCGSETESELYAPYTFYTGDEGAEEDQDWKSRDDEPRMSRLRQRRGRSIVHRSLEDNYGAVVVANHEALAQFLEQENQMMQLPVGLRALKNANPRLKHFNIDALTPVFVGRRIFCPATWNDQTVTLCITFDLAVPTPQRDFYLSSIIEFVDTVPKEIIEKVRSSGNEDMEATISVFPRLHVATVQSFGTMSKDVNNEGTSREASFVLLQLVNALKSLQARGIEDTSKSLNDVVLCREDKDICYRLYLLQGRLNIDPCDEPGEERVSLCECALIALQQLRLTGELPLIRDLLICEKAVTLSQVKSVLEFSLWGPADVPLGGPREREVALQRWLDLERANVLHALVKTKTALTVTDEYQLLFLVRTTAKIMSEASVLLDEQRNRLTRRD